MNYLITLISIILFSLSAQAQTPDSLQLSNRQITEALLDKAVQYLDLQAEQHPGFQEAVYTHLEQARLYMAQHTGDTTLVAHYLEQQWPALLSEALRPVLSAEQLRSLSERIHIQRERRDIDRHRGYRHQLQEYLFFF